jgi:hypothetical protein
MGADMSVEHSILMLQQIQKRRHKEQQKKQNQEKTWRAKTKINQKILML